jgi:hypothetical protein
MLEHEPNEPLPPNGPAVGAQADKPRPAAPAVLTPISDEVAYHALGVCEDLVAPVPAADEVTPMGRSDFAHLLGYFRARRMGRFHP